MELDQRIRIRALRPSGGYVGATTRNKRRQLTARESAIAKLPELQQTLYWCIDYAGEDGLTDRDAVEMLAVARGYYRVARDALLAAGLIECRAPECETDADRWIVTESD